MSVPYSTIAIICSNIVLASSFHVTVSSSAYSLVGKTTTIAYTSSYYHARRPVLFELFGNSKTTTTSDAFDYTSSSSDESEDDATTRLPVYVADVFRATTTPAITTPAATTASTGRRIFMENTIRVGAATCVPLLSFPNLAMGGGIDRQERCDAVDPRCGADGKLRSTMTGKPIPGVTNKITHVVQLIIDIGERKEEAGFLRFGLYGEDCPTNVRTMLDFLTTRGITSVNDKEDLENRIGIQTQPVTILEEGIVPSICPGKGIEFGIPSQKKAFAKGRGLRTPGDNFVPQSRPLPSQEVSARKHDVAGLISVPEKGIGYGGTKTEPIDEAYASAFLVTADDVSSELFDTKLNRRVIGQIIDNESMEFLARLASLPIQKRAGGIGIQSGPPLLKVSVRDADVQKVPNKKK